MIGVHKAKTQPVTTRTVPTPIGSADAIEIACSVDGTVGGFAFHQDGDVTMAVAGGGEVVMSSEAAKAFIAALSERVNRD